jgi:hypothetical protein
MKIQVAVFWVVTLCSDEVGFSEDPTTSLHGATTHKTATSDLNHHQVYKQLTLLSSTGEHKTKSSACDMSPCITSDKRINEILNWAGFVKWSLMITN